MIPNIKTIKLGNTFINKICKGSINIYNRNITYEIKRLLPTEIFNMQVGESKDVYMLGTALPVNGYSAIRGYNTSITIPNANNSSSFYPIEDKAKVQMLILNDENFTWKITKISNEEYTITINGLSPQETTWTTNRVNFKICQIDSDVSDFNTFTDITQEDVKASFVRLKTGDNYLNSQGNKSNNFYLRTGTGIWSCWLLFEKIVKS